MVELERYLTSMKVRISERNIIVKDILNNLYDSLKSDITNPQWMKEFEEYIRGN